MVDHAVRELPRRQGRLGSMLVLEESVHGWKIPGIPIPEPFRPMSCLSSYSQNNPMKDPESLLPLKPVEALVLTMLASGERHGYAIRQEIIDHTGGKIELEAGNLYRYIRRLEEDELIEQSARRPGGNEDPRRVYYRMTPFGRRVLAAEMHRMRELLALAESRRIIGSKPA
jgi:DNA-binding PadR family transcriptional regulator